MAHTQNSDQQAPATASAEREATHKIQKKSSQARFRERQKARAASLEATAQELQDRVQALEAERAQHEAQLAELNRTVSELGLQPRPAAVAGSHTEGVEQLDDSGAAAVAALLVLMRGPHAPGAAPLACRVVSVESMADMFTENVRRCEALLAMGADVRGSPVHEQLTRQVQQFITVYFHIWHHHRRLLQRLTKELVRRKQGANSDPPDRAPEAVVAAMQLTEEQTEALVRGYAEMTAKLRGIYSAQKTAVGYLAESAEQAPARSHGPEGDYVQFQLHVASHQLREVVRECALTALRDLTPVQIARGLIADEPYVLDVLHLGAHIAAMQPTQSASVDSDSNDVLAWLLSEEQSGSSAEWAMSLGSWDLPGALESLDDILDPGWEDAVLPVPEEAVLAQGGGEATGDFSDSAARPSGNASGVGREET